MVIRFSTSFALLTISLMMASCGAGPYECTDPLGCVDISPGSPIVIGTLLATSGEQSSSGRKALEIVEMVIAEKEELLGHPIQLQKYATDCTTESARTAATDLARNPVLIAVIGPTCTDEVIVATPILQSAGIPSLSPVSNSIAAKTMTNQVISAIEQVVIQMPDNTLFIPRYALINALHISP
jgi:ABC-type branched-subunit amino acid transport system substrate-binding protein